MALEKAVITNTVTGDQVPVMFNPNEYTVNRNTNFAQAAIPGLSSPVLQFVNGNMQTLEMELFLDSYEEHRQGSRLFNRAREDVRTLTRRITSLMDIDATTHAPPVLIFTWASLAFTCVLSQVSQRFVLFLPDGVPVRARLQVTFNEYRSAETEAKEVKRETADYTKRWTVSQGETLSSIAARTYDDPRLWRVIALANRLERTRPLTAGMQLALPNLPYRDPDSGRVFS